eukprot:gene47112-42691_t
MPAQQGSPHTDKKEEGKGSSPAAAHATAGGGGFPQREHTWDREDSSGTAQQIPASHQRSSGAGALSGPPAERGDSLRPLAARAPGTTTQPEPLGAVAANLGDTTSGVNEVVVVLIRPDSSAWLPWGVSVEEREAGLVVVGCAAGS